MDRDDDVESESTAAASRESTPQKDWASLERHHLCFTEKSYRDK
jgi:hypothetical protein